MKMIYTHMGLGDHIICCGMMRTLASRDKVSTFVKPHNYASVAAMLDPLEIPLIVCDEGRIKDFAPVGIEPIGFWKWDRKGPFDQAFYHHAGVNFSDRWSNFHCERDLHRETALKNLLTMPNEEPYIFVHDDPQRGYQINESLLPPLRAVRPTPGLTPSIFDYLTLMEGAAEVHLIESAFSLMADSVGNWQGRMCLHRYARGIPKCEEPTYRLPWEILV